MRRNVPRALVLAALFASSVHAQNLIQNPRIAGGTLVPWIHGANQLYLNPMSATNDGSGSGEGVLVLPASAPSGIASAMLQCVQNITAGTTYDFGGKIFIPNGQPGGGGGEFVTQWYSGTACDGSFLANNTTSEVDSSGLGTGAWWGVRASGVAPAGAHSVLFDAAIVSRAPGAPYHVLYDEMYLQVAGCQVSGSTLCLDDQAFDGRFAVSSHYSTTQSGGLSGDAHAISLAPIAIFQGGLFWFFDPTNPEMLAKVINGCATNGNFWVFLTAGTNVGMTTTVRDSFSGRTRLYDNADRHTAAPVQDTTAFACTNGDLREPSRGAASTTCFSGPPVRNLAGDVTTEVAGCTSDATTVCIGNRFQVQTTYHTSQGGGFSGPGCAVSLAPFNVSAGGLFYFFDYGNPEMLLKVLDGCSLNGHFWVFYSAATNVGFTVTVTDTQTGHQHVYNNTDLHAAAPVQDTQALVCP